MPDPVQIRMQYKPERTPYKFHQSKAFVRALMGPFGSGKSVACVWEILLKAREQKAVGKLRKSRWAIIRNTYPELISTTIKTWKDWIPEAYGSIVYGSPISCHAKIPMSDGTVVDLEVIFVSLDKEKDVRKTLSLELTGVWVNEAREIGKNMIDALTGRVGRYPAKAMGGASWSGIIMDTNPPDTDHWFYRLFEVEKPRIALTDGTVAEYEVFKQPAALHYSPSGELLPNKEAENIKNLQDGYNYYVRMAAGKSKEWIKVYIMGQYGATADGIPVYPEYRDDWHTSEQELLAYTGTGLIVGMDFALMPAAAICQYSPKGQFRVLDELQGVNVGARTFARNVLKPFLSQRYHGASVTICGDPAGSARAQTDEKTVYEILKEEGFNAIPASTNAFQARRESVAKFLMESVDAQPAFLLSPTCKMMRKGFIGKYRFQRVQVVGKDYMKDEPVKDEYSHLHDALQYAAMAVCPRANMAIGESAVVIQRPTYIYA